MQGIFATHLHALLDMQLEAPRLRHKCMETASDGRYIRATMRMRDGDCRESLALVVMAAAGVPEAIVRRSEVHYEVGCCACQVV